MASKIVDTDSDLRITFASNLKRLMFQNDLTQKQIADKLEVTTAAVSAWCNGLKMPRPETIDKLCKILKTDRSGLMERYNYRHIEVNEKQKPSTGSFTMEDILLAQKIARLDKYRRNLIAHIIETEPEQ